MQVQVQTMEVSLGNELLEGEELIWSGRPAQGGKSVASSPARVFLILGLIYAGIGLLSVLLGLIFALTISSMSAAGGFLGFVIPGGIFCLPGVLFLILGRFASFAPRSTFYAITNRRVIIVRGGRYVRTLSYDVRAITQVQRFERADGSGDLIFSDTLAGSSGVYSNRTTNSNNGFWRPNAFVAISNVRQAEQRLLGVIGKE